MSGDEPATPAVGLKAPSDAACTGCAALCCREVAIPIPQPKAAAEAAQLRWYLHMDTTRIEIDGGCWLLVISGRCGFLGDDSMCTIYEHRPQQCRDYRAPYCQRYMRSQRTTLHEPADLDRYCAEQFRG